MENEDSTDDEDYETKKSKNKVVWSNASDWSKKELEEASSKKLIPETMSGMDFTKPVTRKDFAAIAVKLYESISKKNAEKSSNNPFKDTNDEYVLKAFNLNITNGVSETEFSPESQITREQMATMMLRALDKAGIKTEIDVEKAEKFVDEDEMHDWGKNAIYYMSDKGIIKGISTFENRFGVSNNATIEQAIAISLRCKKAL